jgi:hypothetical protein
MFLLGILSSPEEPLEDAAVEEGAFELAVGVELHPAIAEHDRRPARNKETTFWVFIHFPPFQLLNSRFIVSQ